MGLILPATLAASQHPSEERVIPLLRATFAEIPVTDLDRAIDFYRGVFDCAVNRTIIDGHDAALLDDAEPGSDEAIDGAAIALMAGESYVPSLDGTRIYITVSEVESTLRRAVECGGEVLFGPEEVSDSLIVAEFSDSEGNRIALSSR